MIKLNNISNHRLSLKLHRELLHGNAQRKQHLLNHPHETQATPEARTVVVDEKKLKELQDALLHKQAEFENFRKRIRRETESKVELANQGLVEELLPVLDNFKRAMQNPGDSVEALLSGIQMVEKQLIDVLRKSGLEPIEAIGQEFDPNMHEAVSTAPSEEHAANTVTEVFQDGYKLKDRLLRPAMVRVARD